MHALNVSSNSLLNVLSLVFVLFSVEFSVIKLSIALVYVPRPVRYYCPRALVSRFDNYVLSKKSESTLQKSHNMVINAHELTHIFTHFPFLPEFTLEGKKLSSFILLWGI